MTLHSINSKSLADTSLESDVRSLKLALESLRIEMELRDARTTQAIEHLTYRLETEMPIRERLAVLEDRSARA